MNTADSSPTPESLLAASAGLKSSVSDWRDDVVRRPGQAPTATAAGVVGANGGSGSINVAVDTSGVLRFGRHDLHDGTFGDLIIIDIEVTDQMLVAVVLAHCAVLGMAHPPGSRRRRARDRAAAPRIAQAPRPRLRRAVPGHHHRRETRRDLTIGRFNRIHTSMPIMNKLRDGAGGVASAGSMARKPRQVKPGSHRQSDGVADADIVAQIDAYAQQLTDEDPIRRVTTRTDALRALVLDGLKHKRGK